LLREERKEPHILIDEEFWKVWNAKHAGAKFALILA